MRLTWLLAGAISSGSLVPAFAAAREIPADIQALSQLKQRMYLGTQLREAKPVVQAITAFGLEHHARLAQGAGDGNVVTSPFSIVSDLVLAMNGARGETLRELETGLKFRGTNVALTDMGLAGLYGYLSPAMKAGRISVANAVFADEKYALEPSYLKAIGSLGAEVRRVDFSRTAEALRAINGYVEKQTQGKVRDLIGELPPHASLVNAGYFKDSWAVPFRISRTEPATFHGARGEQPVAMMEQLLMARLYSDQGLDLVTLAYQDAEFAFDLIVPRIQEGEDSESALKRVEAQLTAENYGRWIHQANELETRVRLPRFRVAAKGDLAPDLAARMPRAFGPQADFSGMSPQGFEIPALIHAAVLEVNEKGTEGAFATAVAGRSLPSMVTADHSFVAVVRHTQTGTPLFVATVRNPESLPAPTN